MGLDQDASALQKKEKKKKRLKQLRSKQQRGEKEKMFANYITDRGFISSIYTELEKINDKKTNH